MNGPVATALGTDLIANSETADIIRKNVMRRMSRDEIAVFVRASRAATSPNINLGVVMAVF